MDSQWQDVFRAAGLEAPAEATGLALGGHAQAESAAISDGNAIALLYDRAVLRVGGADAEQFLQGQLTADVSTLGEHDSRLAAWCTPKGRVMFLLRLLRQGDHYLLVLPRDQVEDCLGRLRLYVLRADVQAERDDSLLVMGLAGPGVRRRLEAQPGLPGWTWPAPGTVTWRGGAGLAGLDDGPGQSAASALLVAPVGEAIALLDDLTGNADALPVGPAAWRLKEVEAGQPWLGAELSEQFLPQMLNLDHLNGISFEKGCYVGQEIVARTQYLGRLKRRLYKARVQGDAQGDTDPGPGDAVYVPGHGAGSEPGTSTPARGEHAAGTIVAAGQDGSGRWTVLAVCSIDDAARGDLRLRHVFGPRLELEDLPYPLASKAG